MRIIGVTACTAGIAHTYLVKEKLINAANELGFPIKIEREFQKIEVKYIKNS